MASRWVGSLSLLGAVMLIGMAAMHGSGYGYVARSIEESQLPDFLKTVLPPLYLYPSVLLAVLALFVFASWRMPAGRALVLALVCILVAANSILGFLLGGLIPGVVLLLAAGVFGLASRLAVEKLRESRK